MFRTKIETVFDECGIVKVGMWLKVWAYIRVVADVMGIGYLGFIFLVFTSGRGGEFFTELSINHLIMLLIKVLIVDLGFIITFIVGLYKQSFLILRVIYYYEMYAIAALVLMVPVTLYTIYAADPYFEGTAYYIGLAAVGVLMILVESYVFLAVKSLLVQLSNIKTRSERVPNEDEDRR